MIAQHATIIYGHRNCVSKPKLKFRVKWSPNLIYVSLLDNLNKFDTNMPMEYYMLSVCML